MHYCLTEFEKSITEPKIQVSGQKKRFNYCQNLLSQVRSVRLLMWPCPLFPPPLLLLQPPSFLCCEENNGKPKTPDFEDPRSEQIGTLRTGVTRTLAEYDLSIPLYLYLGPPLKLLGLLELLSKLWKTIFPEEFIRGLSTETPRTGTVASGALRIVLRPTLLAGAFKTRTLEWIRDLRWLIPGLS